MVVEAVPSVDFATGIIHFATTRRSIVARVTCHVGLETDDGGDVMFTTRVVKLQDPVEVPVVGNADCRLAVRLSGEHHVLNTRGTVEHRVLGVVVKVDETVSAH